jgi:hypothetical protein
MISIGYLKSSCDFEVGSSSMHQDAYSPGHKQRVVITELTCTCMQQFSSLLFGRIIIFHDFVFMANKSVAYSILCFEEIHTD